MKRNLSIQLKAGLLLIIFAMNTIIGFACTVGLDIGFKSKNYDVPQKIKSSIHLHADGHKHEHPIKANKDHHNNNTSNEKNTCCNGKVLKFQNEEKNITAKKIIDAPTFVTVLSSHFGIGLFNFNKIYGQKNLKRFFYPPPTDILLSIQKFQI